MIWPGMGDPVKRKKTIRFLAITAGIAVVVALGSTLVQIQLSKDDPLKVCINNHETHYKISATLELWVDNKQVPIPANMGNTPDCRRSMYTLADDGVVYAEWDQEYPFEVGHFLWMSEFKLRDMDESKSVIYVNGKASDEFIRTPFKDGYHYKAVFLSKEFEEGGSRDFLPPDQ